MTRLLFILTTLLTSLSLSAQNSNMEDFMYSSGKINVVIAVILIIITTFFIYLFRLDRRLKNMED